MPLDVAATVTAYWRNYELSQGDRQQRHEADAHFWAWEAVQEALNGPDEDALALLDALLVAPNADPCCVGAGPVEDMLSGAGTRWQGAIAFRCRGSDAWRQAVSCVSLDPSEREAVPHLREYLGPASAEEPRGKTRPSKKTSRDVGVRHRR